MCRRVASLTSAFFSMPHKAQPFMNRSYSSQAALSSSSERLPERAATPWIPRAAAPSPTGVRRAALRLLRSRQRLAPYTSLGSPSFHPALSRVSKRTQVATYTYSLDGTLPCLSLQLESPASRSWPGRSAGASRLLAGLGGPWFGGQPDVQPDTPPVAARSGRWQRRRARAAVGGGRRHRAGRAAGARQARRPRWGAPGAAGQQRVPAGEGHHQRTKAARPGLNPRVGRACPVDAGGRETPGEHVGRTSRGQSGEIPILGTR